MPVTRMIKFDATRTATELKNQKNSYSISSVYGSLDGAVNAYSTIKSYFDFTHCTESQVASFDAMHEWITTPSGFAMTIGSSLAFTLIANRANVHEKKAIGKIWKYLRETTQASRNAFKGFRGTILTAELFSAQNLRYLILPTSLGLGCLYVANRILMVGVKEERDKKLNANNTLFAALMNYGTFVEIHQKISQDELTRTAKNHRKQYFCIQENLKTSFVYIDGKGEQKLIRNKYIIHQTSDEQEELYYINYQGEAERIAQANIKALKEMLAKNTKAHYLSLLQLNELLPHGVAQAHFNALKKEKAKFQPSDRRALYFAIRAYNGLIDGLYLYIGILSLVTLSPHALIFAATLSTIYCLLCVVSRVYEEYQSQQNILISQHKINLAVAGKELELQLIKLNEIAIRIAQETNETNLSRLKIQQKNADEDLDKQLKIFEAARKTLIDEYRLSRVSAVLLGIKHGLPVYGALISAVLVVAFFFSLTATPLPAFFVLAIITSGALIIPLFILHAFLTRKKLDSKDAIEIAKQDAANLGKIVADVKESFRLTHQDAKNAHQADLIRSRAKKTFIDWITLSLQADPLSDTYYPDGAELIRAFCSGFLKGKKEIEFLLNPLQQADADGHYQDTAFMLLLIIPAAFLYAVVFALKAFSKGFSRTQANQENFNYLAADYPNSAEEETPPKNKTMSLLKIELLGEEKVDKSSKKITERDPNKKTVRIDLINLTHEDEVQIEIARKSPSTVTQSQSPRSTPRVEQHIKQTQAKKLKDTKYLNPSITAKFKLFSNLAEQDHTAADSTSYHYTF